MQKLSFVFCIAVLAIACNSEKKEPATGTTETSTETTAKTPVSMPYTAAYSSSWEMGNPEYASMILQGSWKDWELNKMDNMKSWAADTLRAFTSSNKIVSGADSLMALWKRYRSGYTSVIDTIHAVIPVYSTDKKENWVLVWATEINTLPDGKKDTIEVMETWRINKDGKADILYQYDRHARKQ